MVQRILIFFLGFTSTFTDETIPRMENFRALQPLLNEPSPSLQNTEVNQQTLQMEGNDKQQQLRGNLAETLQQVQPTSYKLYDASLNNYASGGCSSNSYYSVSTLLSILSILLEFLDHSMESDKAYTVCELIKTYLEGAPQSQETIDFLAKVRLVEEHLLHRTESVGGDHTEYFNFYPPHDQKITIVFQKDLPGTDQQNCRETFDRLIQTAVNIYKETAKHPQCQPSGVIDENLYYPSDYVKPQKPYQFLVIYQNPPSAYYTPDYSGISILPDLGVKPAHLDHLYQSLPTENPYGNIPSDGINSQYFLPSGQNQKNPSLPLLQKEKPHYDILALIRQYNLLHPNSTTNRNNILELLRNITGIPSYNPPSLNNPYDILKPDILQNRPSEAISYGPVNPGILHIYPNGPHQYPGVVNDQLQNHPGLIFQNPKVPTYPPLNNGYVPVVGYYKSEHPSNKLKPVNTQSKPELTLEILLSLLRRPEGEKVQSGLNPQLKSQMQYLYPNNPNNQILDLQMQQNPDQNPNYLMYGTDGLPVQQSVLDYLKQIQADSQTGVLSGNGKTDSEALLKKMQHWLGVSNGNRLPSLQNKANVIELTYVLKRPKPLLYRPIYYVKYRLPYQTFLQNFQNLIFKKPGLRSEPANVYQELISVSNISDISPSLKSIGKEEILKLVFGNGTLVDARIVDVPDSVLNEQLAETRIMNAELDPKVIEELSGNLGLNKSQSDPNPDDGLDWLKPPPLTSKHDEDLAMRGIRTNLNLPAQLAETNSSFSVNQGSSSYPNQVLGLSAVSGVPRHPLNVAPLTSDSKSLKN